MDIDLLDKYDSFYKTTKSLLVLFQIMGVMPIARCAPGEWCDDRIIRIDGQLRNIVAFQEGELSERPFDGSRGYSCGPTSSTVYCQWWL